MIISDNIQKDKKPKVSVVISTYNDETYIKEAVDSILNQTLTDIEVFVVDDGSTDRTGEILHSIEDSRLMILTNDINRGIAYSRNRAMRMSRGDYIAQMDGDDISLPRRLEVQYNYMEKNRNISVCGTYAKCFGRSKGVITPKEESDSLKCELLFVSPLPHSSWMMRKSDIDRYGLYYDETYRTSLDYELMYRSLGGFEIACIEEVLVKYRVHSKSITGKMKGIDKNMVRIQKQIMNQLHISWSKRTKVLLNKYRELNSWCSYIDFVSLMILIIKQNAKYNIFDKSELRKFLFKMIKGEFNKRYGGG